MKIKQVLTTTLLASALAVFSAQAFATVATVGAKNAVKGDAPDYFLVYWNNGVASKLDVTFVGDSSRSGPAVLDGKSGQNGAADDVVVENAQHPYAIVTVTDPATGTTIADNIKILPARYSEDGLTCVNNPSTHNITCKPGLPLPAA